MKEKYLSKGSIILFVIAIVATLIAGLVCFWCGADKVTIVASSALAGIVSVMGLGACFEAAKLPMPMGPESGFVGVILGVILTLLLF